MLLLTYVNPKEVLRVSINYAILGILTCKPLTGYDLKKIIQDSPFMPWSGNNNQIYKALVELLHQGLVTSEVHHQESSPPKKIYTITKEGREELKEWVLTPPELPEMKKSFLVQLAWADLLSKDELDGLLAQYEEALKMQLLFQREKQRRGNFAPDRTPREKLIWELIYQNIIASYEQELAWVEKVRSALCGYNKEMEKMNYRVIEKNEQRYIECASQETPIRTEQQALDLIAACFENDTNRVMLHAPALAEDFFNLRTGLAGSVLQKFGNYQIKVALVLPDQQKVKGRFREFITEANRGNSFKVFGNKIR